MVRLFEKPLEPLQFRRRHRGRAFVRERPEDQVGFAKAAAPRPKPQTPHRGR